MDKTTGRIHTPSGVPAAAGTIAHQVIGDLLTTDAQQVLSVTEVDRMVEHQCRSLGRSLNARRARALALTSACKYLSLLRPTRAEFIGAEVTLTVGEQPHQVCPPVGDVFIDELKTARYLDETSAVMQATRYAQAGADIFGDGFAGVRVVTTTQERRSLLITPDLNVLPLADTPLAIRALRTPAVIDLRAV